MMDLQGIIIYHSSVLSGGVLVCPESPNWFRPVQWWIRQDMWNLMDFAVVAASRQQSVNLIPRIRSQHAQQKRSQRCGVIPCQTRFTLGGWDMFRYFPYIGGCSYIHTYIHTYIDTYIHAYIHTYIHIHIHTYIHTYIHRYIHTYMHACIHTYIYIYIHTYIHTYIYIYIHIWYMFHIWTVDWPWLTHSIRWEVWYLETLTGSDNLPIHPMMLRLFRLVKLSRVAPWQMGIYWEIFMDSHWKTIGKP